VSSNSHLTFTDITIRRASSKYSTNNSWQRSIWWFTRFSAINITFRTPLFWTCAFISFNCTLILSTCWQSRETYALLNCENVKYNPLYTDIQNVQYLFFLVTWICFVFN
jgi:hypothetical protein